MPQVGLGGVRAQLGTMADKDGLPADFPYDYEFQWMRVDGATETVIGDATEWFYHPKRADIGHALKVEVTFNRRRPYDRAARERAERGGRARAAGLPQAARRQ